MAAVKFLLGFPWDVLLSLGIAGLNISIIVAQEMLARGLLKGAEPRVRPQATVIREGIAKSIDPSEIDSGDVVFVGPGDQFLVDGKILSEKPILVDQSMLIGEGNHLMKNSGEDVFAGSLCVSCRAAYQAEKVGDERLDAPLTGRGH